MELLERFTRGDLDAFETLFRQFQADVYAWVIRIVRDPAVAEELTVETFWQIYRARARFDPRREFTPWARHVATNLAINHLRAVRPAVSLPDEVPAQPAPDPVVRRDARVALTRAFGQLPPKLRAVASLALIEERPYAEIAEALGITEGTVKTRVFRAVRALRDALRRLGMEP